MSQTYGFELVREQEIRELNTVARLYRHVKTGAELLSMINDDENKVFGITFCTLPTDSTGVPHILEHSVLNGSRKYPLKQPFVELLKGSVQSFVNAVTYPDKTIYPIASQNTQDFYNIVDVYMDAVFFPTITPQTLQQEGWHYELESLDAPLTYKGVVFNEMKGAYSDPANLMSRYTLRSVFPDNVYGNDAGGDPTVIPDLTYEQFKNFHDTYYHPSNARIWFYGDDDPTKRLELMAEYLDQFEARKVDGEVALQSTFDEPIRMSLPYDASDDGEKAFITVNWLLPEPLDATRQLAWEVLSRVLVGTPASPLRKALIDSGLGEDLMSEGLESGLRQVVFAVGMRGVEVENLPAVEKLIEDTLANLVRDGIDRETINAAINTIEFQMRELNSGSFPRGILLLLASLNSWLYGDDPLAPLAFEKPLAEVKAALTENPRLFEQMAEEMLLNNMHRSTVVLEPQTGLRAKLEADERRRLDEARAKMSEAELQAVLENTKALQLMQQTPDSPEALATIPRLKLGDLDKKNKLIPLEISDVQGSKFLYHDLFTNGIIYLDVAFDLHSLPQDLLPYVKLFGQALVEIGTDKEDFVRLSQRIGSKTGGVRPNTLVSAIRNQPGEAAYFMLRAKSTMAQASDMLAILQDVLLSVKLDNKERFRQMVLEAKATIEAGLLPSGHAVSWGRLGAHFGGAGWVNGSQIGGIDYLLFLRQLAKDVEQNWPAVLEKLESVRRLLINRQAMLVNLTLDDANWQTFSPRLNEFIATLPTSAAKLHNWSPPSFPLYEGLTLPAQVNYVAKGGNLFQQGYQLHGSASVVARHLGLAFVLERVRVQGGAYGGFAVFDINSGMFGYISYRDPNLLNTVAAYDDAPGYLRSLDLSQEELTSAIIGTVSDIDAYQLPDAKGFSSMARYLAGITDEMRQQHRDEVLATTSADFNRFGDVLEPLISNGHVVVLGSQDAVEQANAAKGSEWLKTTKVM